MGINYECYFVGVKLGTGKLGALLIVTCHISGCSQKCDTPEGQSLTFRSELVIVVVKSGPQMEYLS